MNISIKKAIVSLVLISAGFITVYARDFVEKKGMTYRNGAERCVMDIYFPADAESESLPVIVWFHGGGLTGGNREIPEGLKTGEYVVVAPGYRLLPDVELSDCIDDAAKAVAWVIDSISKYGGDSQRLFVSGHSAGGYLTSMIGLDKKWLGKYGKNPDEIAGLIPLSGQAITHFAQREKFGISPLTPVIDEFAPLYHVRKNAPPYIIITGDKELELFGRFEENAYMWRMMKLTGHPYVKIYQLEGYDHGSMATPALHILKNSIKEILENKGSEPRNIDYNHIAETDNDKENLKKESHDYLDRVAIGYNLELNKFVNDKINVGHGISARYIHSFSVSRKEKLFIDFGVVLDFARIGDVDYYAASSGYGVDADHYTDYTFRLPASLSWRADIGKLSLLPYAGIQLGVLFHHEPNDHDGKVYLNIPIGGQMGLGAIYKRWYYGLEGSYVVGIMPWTANITFSFGYTF